MPGSSDSSKWGFEIGDAGSALDALIRHTGDCVKIIDLDGRVVRWSPSCEDVYGWATRDVLGEILPHVPEQLRLRTIADIRAVASAGRVAERDLESQRADGTRLTMRLILVPLNDTDGHAAGVMSIAHELLGDDRLDKQRAGFASFIGASLSEPLATIANAAGLLLRPEISQDTGRRGRLAATIADRARSAGQMVDDLMVTSLLGKGELVLDREPANLVALVTDVLGEIGESASRIVADFDMDLPPVLVDAPRIGRAVSILTRKALKQTPAGRNVQVSVFARGGFVAIEVRDKGKPIEASEAERIFDRHYFGPETRAAEDAGMGLYLVHGIAEAHGGRVALSSGSGVAFTIMLPMADESV